MLDFGLFLCYNFMDYGLLRPIWEMDGTYMAEVAVIMASYNGAKYIGEQIESILGNSFDDIELHVCDDGSTDETEEIVNTYVEKNPGKVFFHKNKENLGVIRNFLEGMKCADCPYYMFSDQDDVWEKDKILHTLERMKQEENKNVNIPIAVFGDAYMVDANLKSMNSTFQKTSNVNPTNTKLSHLVVENTVIGCTLMINAGLKELVRNTSLQIKMHDWWLALIATSMGKLVYLDEPLLKYRQHENNTLGAKSELAYATENVGKLKKIRDSVHESCFQAEAFLSCYGDKLTEEQRKIFSYFAEIPKLNWFARKYRIVHGKYFKTGLLKNFALLLII